MTGAVVIFMHFHFAFCGRRTSALVEAQEVCVQGFAVQNKNWRLRDSRARFSLLQHLTVPLPNPVSSRQFCEFAHQKRRRCRELSRRLFAGTKSAWENKAFPVSGAHS